jgi:hypothetical protein
MLDEERQRLPDGLDIMFGHAQDAFDSQQAAEEPNEALDDTSNYRHNRLFISFGRTPSSPSGRNATVEDFRSH